MMSDELRPLLTLEELMERLKLSRATIFRLRAKGLPAVKVGRSLRFDPVAVKQWIFEHEQGMVEPRSGHLPGPVRERLVDAFEEAAVTGREWWETFDSAQEALQLLGKLWNCTDAVPASTRESAADWIAYVVPGDQKTVSSVRSGCTYAVLVRTLKPLLTLVLERTDKA